MRGTITISPKNPYTTDGIPFSNSITGFRNPRVRLLATSDIYTATDNPNGNAKRIAKKLTQSVPMTKGTKPNCGAGVAVGNHSLPANTSEKEICSSFSKRPGKSFSINFAGTKAMIPGWSATTLPIHSPALSYSAPNSSSENKK